MAINFTKLGIRDFRQFKDVTFDFVDPKTGSPLEKVCFVGGNGTGKSTVLEFLRRLSGAKATPFKEAPEFLASSFKFGDKYGLVSLIKKNQLRWDSSATLENGFASDCDFHQLSLPSEGKPNCPFSANALASAFSLFSPPDSEQSNSFKLAGPNGILNGDLSESLEQMENPPAKQDVGQGFIELFWVQLVAMIKKREKDFLNFQKQPENKEKTVRAVEEEFLNIYPEVLKSLSEFWAPLLDRAGLSFDYEGASEPIQLTDKLEAYVRLKKTGQKIPYHLLSTGIRNFIFKLGHIFTVFHRFPEKDGFLFVDEPENSLHPDFLYDLVDFYQRAAPKAQLFMATHNPIVAAQFRPEERFVLSFDDDFNVKVTRGVSPEGDDPNDVLRNDFEVRNIYGRKGLEAWERYKELQRQIEDGAVQDVESVTEFMELGQTYNFPTLS